jgi:transmembrane sensor
MTEPDRSLAKSRDAIEARAADFLQRRYLMRWTAGDQAELDDWLDEDTAHRVAFLRLEAGAASVARLSDLGPPWFNRMLERWRLRLQAPFLAAAGFAGIVAAAYVASPYLLMPADRAFTTDVGGRAVIKFGDRSEVELNTDTAVRYRMTTAERTVWLDRGEAWFHVAHDAAHPFTVIAGNRRITDLGTEFLVRRGSKNLEVALLKGRAAVSAEGAQTAMLAPGDELFATPFATALTHKSQQELADETAWRKGFLLFHRTKLVDAIGEVNRYSKAKLVIRDPVVANMTIGGAFETDSLAGFLEAMQSVLKLNVAYSGTDIVLSRAPNEQKHTRTEKETHSR